MQENGSQLEIFKGSIGLSVQQSEISNWLFDRSEEEISVIEESFKELDGAYFITNPERTLISNIREVVEYGVEPNQGWEKFASDLAEQVWNEYEMAVKE